MSLTLTTHDTGYADPDAATIAKVLSSLDGGQNVLATLGSDLTYVQASGSVQSGFALEYQEGALDAHYKSRGSDLSLERVTEVFQRYAVGDASWREGIEWDLVPYVQEKIPWYSTWVGYTIILLIVITLIWLWRG